MSGSSEARVCWRRHGVRADGGGDTLKGTGRCCGLGLAFQLGPVQAGLQGLGRRLGAQTEMLERAGPQGQRGQEVRGTGKQEGARAQGGHLTSMLLHALLLKINCQQQNSLRLFMS